MGAVAASGCRAREASGSGAWPAGEREGNPGFPPHQQRCPCKAGGWKRFVLLLPKRNDAAGDTAALAQGWGLRDSGLRARGAQRAVTHRCHADRVCGCCGSVRAGLRAAAVPLIPFLQHSYSFYSDNLLFSRISCFYGTELGRLSVLSSSCTGSQRSAGSWLLPAALC